MTPAHNPDSPDEGKNSGHLSGKSQKNFRATIMIKISPSTSMTVIVAINQLLSRIPIAATVASASKIKKAASLAGKSGRKMFTYLANPFARALLLASHERSMTNPMKRLNPTLLNHSYTYRAAHALYGCRQLISA